MTPHEDARSHVANALTVLRWNARYEEGGRTSLADNEVALIRERLEAALTQLDAAQLDGRTS